MMTTNYLGLDVNDLANFKLSVTLGFSPNGDSKAARLGTALAAETDAASRAMARLIEPAPHAETSFVAECYRGALVDAHLLAVANGVA